MGPEGSFWGGSGSEENIEIFRPRLTQKNPRVPLLRIFPPWVLLQFLRCPPPDETGSSQHRFLTAHCFTPKPLRSLGRPTDPLQSPLHHSLQALRADVRALEAEARGAFLCHPRCPCPATVLSLLCLGQWLCLCVLVCWYWRAGAMPLLANPEGQSPFFTIPARHSTNRTTSEPCRRGSWVARATRAKMAQKKKKPTGRQRRGFLSGTLADHLWEKESEPQSQ